MHNAAALQGSTARARERSLCDLENAVWERTALEAEATAKAVRPWQHVVRTLAPEHQEVLATKASGLQPVEAAAVLGLSPLETWDRTLEAEAAARQAAGAPDLDPALEQRMKAFGLWPVEAKPLSVNMGAVVRRLSRHLRLAIYARLSGARPADLEPQWGMKQATYYQRVKRAQLRLHQLAYGFGVVDDPWGRTDMTLEHAAKILDVYLCTFWLYHIDETVPITYPKVLPYSAGRIAYAHFPAAWAAVAPYVRPRPYAGDPNR